MKYKLKPQIDIMLKGKIIKEMCGDTGDGDLYPCLRIIFTDNTELIIEAEAPFQNEGMLSITYNGVLITQISQIH